SVRCTMNLPSSPSKYARRPCVRSCRHRLGYPAREGIVPAEAARRQRPRSTRWEMKERRIAGAMIGWSLCLAALPASAQTNLPGITVTAPYTSMHGGYLISGDFKVDPRMPQVVFPAQALVKDDILSVQPIHLADDEYLVLQECATADCSQAAIVRVWDAGACDHAGAEQREPDLAQATAMDQLDGELPAMWQPLHLVRADEPAADPDSRRTGGRLQPKGAGGSRSRRPGPGAVAETRGLHLRRHFRGWQHGSHQAHARGGLKRGPYMPKASRPSHATHPAMRLQPFTRPCRAIDQHASFPHT